jgi:predicted GNAT family acetyltransferase
MRQVEEHVFSYDKNLFLFVSSFNSAAVSFYRTLGYCEVGAITDYNFDDQTELLMRKTTGPRLG